MAGRLYSFGLAMSMAVGVALPVMAAPTAEEKAEIQAVSDLMAKAGKLFTESNFKEAGEVVKEAQGRLAKLAEDADPATIGQLNPIHERLERAHSLLKSKGIDLPRVQPLVAAKAKGKKVAKTAPDKPATKATAKPEPAKTAPTKAAGAKGGATV